MLNGKPETEKILFFIIILALMFSYNVLGNDKGYHSLKSDSFMLMLPCVDILCGLPSQ